MRRTLAEASVWLDRQMERNPFFAESGEGAFLLNIVRERNQKLKMPTPSSPESKESK